MSELAPAHAALLKDSAISDEVAAARGYYTATKAIELRRLGFFAVQAITPSLVIPVRGLDGDIVGYQARPDQPRIVDGKPVRYESPGGSTPVLDVPPGAQPFMRSTMVPLWITEGARKSDSAISAGLCCISVAGVWSWVSKIGDAKTVLPDLLRLKLTDRKVVIAFDSDVMTKPAVHAALEKLAAWLESQGAWVHSLYLSAPEDGKVGLDDFLATGAGTDQLWEYVEQGVRPLVIEPKGTALPTGWLLDRIEAFVRRFVRFVDGRGEHEVCILSLFVLHTWAVDAAHATPYLHVRSPAKRAGKTRLLEVLQQVCRNAIRASSISAASVFQLIEAKHPTLLVDEVDALFTSRSEYAEALRAVLNDGYRPGGVAIRGTQDGEPRTFSTYCPKVLSGINTGTLPDTIADRCLRIQLERKLKSDMVDRLRERKIAEATQEMRERLEDWALLAVDRLEPFEVDVIEEVSDRAEEIAEPLLAIAEDAGGDWPARARDAVLALAAPTDAEDDHGTLLLAKLREVFTAVDVITSRQLVQYVRSDDELPFGDLDARELARLLKPYGAPPRTIGSGTGSAKGYRRAQFEKVFAHYLPDQPSQPSHPSHPAGGAGSGATDGEGRAVASVAVRGPDATDATDANDHPSRETPPYERDATDATDATQASEQDGDTPSGGRP